jgi:hypothetical protein
MLTGGPSNPGGVGVPPGERFAGGGCLSCIKPPLAKDPWDHDPDHPFRGWVGDQLKRFIGNGVDDTLDNVSNALENQSPAGTPQSLLNLGGLLLEHRNDIMDYIVTPMIYAIPNGLDAMGRAMVAAPGAIGNFLSTPREDPYSNSTLDGM